MNPVILLLKQTMRNNKFEIGDGGEPVATLEDSILASANSHDKYYIASRVVTIGDDSADTVSACESYLLGAIAEIARHKKWDIPKGAQAHRNLCSLAIAEHLRPTWFKNQMHRVMFFNELNEIRKPTKPLLMTIDKWKKKWGYRYKICYDELNEMSNMHLRHMKRKFG